MKKRLSVILASILILALMGNAFAYTTGDDYPNKNSCTGCHSIENGDDHNDYNDRYFYYRQCTDFCAWCLRTRNGVSGFYNRYGGVNWGNAKNWKSAAESLGIPCNGTPAVGAIACWTGGKWGHVAWVEAVNGSSVIIEEYNGVNAYAYARRDISSDPPTCYIHIQDIVKTGTLDVNFLVNGKEIVDITGIGTFE